MTALSKREQVANITLALGYSWFFVNNLAYLTVSFRVSVLILAVFHLLIIAIAILRRPPKRVSLAPFDIVITLLGTYSATFMVGISSQEEQVALQALGGVGLLISLVAVLSLRGSFGLLPADRGIVREGLYRFIRHPIYAGYLISMSCFLAQNYSLWNLGCFVSFCLFETLRLLREEKLLLQNPEYLRYSRSVRWRILPYVW